MLSFFKVFLIPSVGSLNTCPPHGVPSVVGEGVHQWEQGCGKQAVQQRPFFSLKCRNTRPETEGEGLMGRLDNEV